LTTVVIIAGGPSLTRADVAMCEDAGLPLLGINNAFRIGQLNILYACDAKWWKLYHDEVPARLAKFSLEDSGFNDVFQLQSTKSDKISFEWPYVGLGKNSGFQALNLAMLLGFKTILLLGYDMQYGPKGESHWHGDHPKGLNNAPETRLPTWIEHFNDVAPTIRDAGIEVINCSRSTALKCFPRYELEDVLEAEHHPA